MDYSKIKAEAEAIRDAAGLPAQYFPVLVRIQDEPKYYNARELGFAPRLYLMLGDFRFKNEGYGDLEFAFQLFTQEVKEAAAHYAWELRRTDVRARWQARREQRKTAATV